MNIVLNKWSTIVSNEECDALFPESRQIVELTSVVENIRDNNLNLYKAMVKSGGRGNTDRNPKAANNPTSRDSRVNKSPRNNKEYQYACKKVPTKSGEKHMGKYVGDKYYNCYLNHMACYVHTTADCTLK